MQTRLKENEVGSNIIEQPAVVIQSLSKTLLEEMVIEFVLKNLFWHTALRKEETYFIF